MDIIQLMIQKGATINGAMFWAAIRGHTDIVDYLKSLQ